MSKMIACCLLLFILVLGNTEIGSGQGVISLPQTGQTKCYDSASTEMNCSGTGQDGELQIGVEWSDPRFTVSGDCVTDNLTGLMWAKDGNLPNGSRTWQGALDFVSSINAGAGMCGHHDWRLPNINELETLVNAGEENSATWLNSNGFNNVQSYSYWSSTASAYSPYDAWVVHMWDGYVSYYSKSYHDYVWPVRSGQLNNPDSQYPANIWNTGQTTSYASGDDGDLEWGVAWPPNRFTDHGNGTVTDNLTGLMWAKNANLPSESIAWQDALNYIQSINTESGLGGHHDWRLPNKKELFSLIDHSRHNPALPANHPFQNMQSELYWSSTAYAYDTSYAWIVRMWDGYVYDGYKYYGYNVWPVRSGQGSLEYSDISVTPNPVSFGNVNIGEALDQTITVKNDGTANLVIGTITDPASPFSKFTDNCSGQTIPPKGTCIVTYHFAPTTVGNFSSTSNIPSNDADENPKTVDLNGTGIGGEGGLSVTPVEDFNSSGFEGGPFNPSSKDYTLTNMGITSINWGATKTRPWVKLSKTSGTLAAGTSTMVNVSILPNSAKMVGAGAVDDTVTFNNMTDHIGDTTRKVNLLVDAINLKLVSPSDGRKYTVCTCYPTFGSPTFQWEINGGALKRLELQFYNDEDPPKKVTVRAAATELTQKSLQIKAPTWKNILNLAGMGGDKVNWKAVGTKQNNIQVESDIRSFEVGAPEVVRDPKINPIGKAILPTLSWDNNCNSKFKVWFYNDEDYYNSITNPNLKKTSLSFTDTDPTDNSGVFSKELTSSQWISIQNIVGRVTNSTVYWHVESSDVISTKRRTRTDRQEFILKD